MSRLLGYARVSTADQDPALQIDALEAAGCLRIFTDYSSGARNERPELEKLWDSLEEGDTLVVWKLDRFGRSLSHLVNQMTQLQERNIQFMSLTESIDTSSPTGRFIYNMFASIAEFERDLILERTKAGLAAARSRGRLGGRPVALEPLSIQAMRDLYDGQKMTVAQLAKQFGVSRSTVYRHIR